MFHLTFLFWRMFTITFMCLARFYDNCSRGKLPPTPKLTLTETLTLTMVLFSSRAIFWLPPKLKTNPNLDPNRYPNRGVVFLGEQLYGYHLAQRISMVFGLKKRGGNISLLWTNCTYFGKDFSNLLVIEWKQIILVFNFVFFNHFSSFILFCFERLYFITVCNC